MWLLSDDPESLFRYCCRVCCLTDIYKYNFWKRRFRCNNICSRADAILIWKVQVHALEQLFLKGEAGKRYRWCWYSLYKWKQHPSVVSFVMKLEALSGATNNPKKTVQRKQKKEPWKLFDISLVRSELLMWVWVDTRLMFVSTELIDFAVQG